MRNPLHKDIFWFDRKNQYAYIFDFAWQRLQAIDGTITEADVAEALQEAETFINYFYDTKAGPKDRMKHNLR